MIRSFLLTFFVCSVANSQVIIKKKQGMTFTKISYGMSSPKVIGGTKVFFTIKESKSAEMSDSIIENEKKRFLSFFVKDVDPYYFKETNYAECLIDTGKNEMTFYAGPENYWFQCFANQKKQKAKRIWLICGKQVFDIIFVASDFAEYNFTCEK